MRLSVIIPTYNRAHIVCEAIESVLEQKDPDTEIIIVNDGSSDNTDDVVKRYGSSVIYIRKENGGVSSARNKGVENSRGDWLVFLDDDDVMLPGRLASVKKAAQLYPTAMCHMCDAIIELKDRDVRLFELRNIVVHGDIVYVTEPLEYVLRQCCFVWNVAVRRDVFERVGGFRVDAVYEDWDLLSKCACVGGWTVTKAALIRARRVEMIENLSERIKKNKMRSLLSLVKSHKSLLEWFGEGTAMRRRVLESMASAWKGVASEAAKMGDRITWHSAMMKAACCEPSVIRRCVVRLEKVCGFGLYKLRIRVAEKLRREIVR